MTYRPIFATQLPLSTVLKTIHLRRNFVTSVEKLYTFPIQGIYLPPICDRFVTKKSPPNPTKSESKTVKKHPNKRGIQGKNIYPFGCFRTREAFVTKPKNS